MFSRHYALLAVIGSVCAAAAHAQTTTGIVAGGGYFQNAVVCIDANLNARCDVGEVSTLTNSKGVFTLQGTGAVVAQIGPGTTFYDPGTNQTTDIARSLTFRAPVAETPLVVGAVSTELQALIDANGGNFNSAVSQLAARVSVPTVNLLEDYTSETDSAIRGALSNETSLVSIRIADALSDAGAAGDLVHALRNRLALDTIQTVVVIYAENRSFDNLFGLFPGANNLQVAARNPIKQLDRDGVTALPTLPPAWGGLTAAGQAPVVTQAQTTGVWPNTPFQVDDPTNPFGYGVVPQTEITRDLVHKFFEHQMQLDGGNNDLFAAWSDAGGLSMGYFDGSQTQLWKLAQQYTLADNFFQAAFGGSFLNHQYLICACAPEYPNANTAPAHPTIAVLNTDSSGNYLPFLTPSSSSPASAQSGSPTYVSSGAIAPFNYFNDGTFRAVNTMAPPYQPSYVAPAASDSTLLYADPSKGSVLPPQTQTHIGDLLSAKGVNWAWYTGSWDTVLAAATSPGHTIPAAPIFQFHHQPFNYFANFDPQAHAADRAAHLKDRSDLIAAAQAGTLPSVVFYKPQGSQNQHPGYTNVSSGDSEIAGIVGTLQQSPQWPNMLIVVTYDEFGGQFDHVPPPQGDLLGPGTRIPAIIISPFARKGFVDHTQYDTASFLRFLTHRYSLVPLKGLAVRDRALLNNGGKRMSYLGGALDFN